VCMCDAESHEQEAGTFAAKQSFLIRARSHTKTHALPDLCCMPHSCLRRTKACASAAGKREDINSSASRVAGCLWQARLGTWVPPPLSSEGSALHLHAT
jgi:hypothetical protein